MKIPISVTIITLNEENNIAACLDTVSWADEIIVVDAFSTDQTCSIARRYTDKVCQRYMGDEFGEQRQYALSLASHEWVLYVDADERVTKELREGIQKAVMSNQPVSGYKIQRRSFMYGGWLRYGGLDNDWNIRLFRRTKASFTLVKVGEGVRVEGTVAVLQGKLLHYTYPTVSVHVDKINRTTSGDGQGRGRFSILHLFLSPLSKFIRMYFFQKGFLDGMRGFIWCSLSAWYNFLRDLKVWERVSEGTSSSVERGT